MKSKHLGTLALVSLSAAGWGVSLLGGAAPAVGGCLAPRDIVIDSAGALGPFWGNDDGDLLYSLLVDVGFSSEREALKVLGGDGGRDTVAEQGDATGAFLGTESERYTTFHAGALNDAGDVAYVVSTAADQDDPATGFNETIARRALFFKRGGTRHRIARFGENSPVLGPGDVPVPWASIFDATPSNRNPSFSEVVFSAQLGAPDGRTGLFVWDEESQTVSTLALEGDPAPTGGDFSIFGRTRISGDGSAAFFCLVELSDQSVEPSLFLRRPDGSLSRVAEFGTNGDASPNGGRLSILKDFDLDDAGAVVFAAVVVDGAAPSGIFHRTPAGALTTLLLEGDTSALGGTFIDVSFSRVRSNGSGQVVVGVPLSEELDGEGIFAIDPAGPALTPLALAPGLVAVAALGQSAAGYQLESEIRTVVPADGTDEGPTDFRVTKLDVKNAVPLRRDSVKVEGLFRLPADDEPSTFTTSGVTVFQPGGAVTGDDLRFIQKVIVRYGDDPGNELEFGLSGDAAAPGATFAYNGAVGGSPSVKLGKTGRSARWKFSSDTGRGKFTIDLESGTFALRLGSGTIRESFSPIQYRVDFALQTADDVAQGRDPEESFFHRSVLLDADQPDFGSGRRVRSGGERVPGGTLFVDSLTVKRNLKARKGVAAPDVRSDAIKLTGTLRNCPGSTPPTTPGLSGDLQLGDFRLTGINLARKGGTKYVYRSGGSGPKVTLVVDAAGGTFKLKVVGADPLSQLVDADFSGSGGPNDAANDVAGMTLPFRLSVARVYEAEFDVPVVRKKGGKVFTNGR